MTTTTDVGTLIELVSSSAGRHPQRPAVSDHTTTLTYQELDRRSDAVGALVRSHGVRPEDRVGVYLPRSTDLVVAVLGILKAGAAYLAIDDRYPDSRRDHLLRAGGTKLTLTGGDTAFAGAVPGGAVPVTDWTAFDGQRAGRAPRPDSLAAVVFTSGSSGQPKGILLEHRNIAWYATNPTLPQLRPDDRVAQTLSVSFDGFHHELWCTLAAGAELVVLPTIPDLLATGLGGVLRKYRISAMCLPAMVINNAVREDPDALARLRILGSGGDVLLPSACRALLDSTFDGELVNMYGPAEITTSCTIHRVTPDDLSAGTIPIGVELAGAVVRLLDPQMRDVAAGETGEMYVAGPGVARGYLDRPDLTAERFPVVTGNAGPTRMYRTGDVARRDDDGRLRFIGRADRQVKIRGYRVEPGEVEQSLLRFPDVRDAAVLTDGAGDDRRLVAFVVPGDDLDPARLRSRAENDLPAFMVPSEFVVADELPFTEHGKRDTAALGEMLARHKEAAAVGDKPQSDSERYLAALWKELLGVESVGRDDDFYILGGHSLLAFRMSHRISKELDVRFEFMTVLDTPLLRDLAAELDVARAEGAR